MPIMYKNPPDAIMPVGESLTEQEFADSCDINKMVRNMLNGMPARAGDPVLYGYDDTTIDGLQHRINLQKAKEIEQELEEFAKNNEVEDVVFDAFNEHLRQKIKLRKKAKDNDDQTTKNMASKNAANGLRSDESIKGGQDAHPGAANAQSGS